MEDVIFGITSALMLLMSVLVVWARSPLRSALALICSLCCAAVLYILLDAQFVAAMQILVYAGAIMVLFLFVIMLLNLGTEARRPTVSVAMGAKLLGGGAVAYFSLRLLETSVQSRGPGRLLDGSVKHIGNLLLTDYLFNFEAISVLLLVAVVGAIVFGLKRLT